MKFQNVPVGARFLSPNLYEFVKISATHSAFIDDGGRWDTLEAKQDMEVYLITKCENCKNFRYSKDEDAGGNIIAYPFCDKLIDELMFSPETFSCSLFELLDK